MNVPRILIVDDQLARQADLRAELVDRCGLVEVSVTTTDSEVRKKVQDKLAVVVFCSGQAAVGDRVENSLDVVEQAIKTGWPSLEGWRWALILLDLQFDSEPPRPDDGSFGLRILEHLVDHWPDREAERGNTEIPIVMLSSISRTERGRAVGRAGARGYVEKRDLNRQLLQRLLEEHGLIEDRDPLGRIEDGMLLGHSLSLLKVLRRAREISRMAYGNGLILGAQGSGKSSLAEYIHVWSRRSAPFLRYYVRPTAANIEYSTLFGCWKGAHSQADESSPGLVEQAHAGTLVIEEVHGLKSESQQELLEFGRLVDGRRWVRRLGSFPTSQRASEEALRSIRGELNREDYRISVDVLLLSTTNQPLDDDGWRRKHGFEDPLYTRLATEYAGGPICFPNLAARKEDLETLFQVFLERKSRETRGRWPKEIDPQVFKKLEEYEWPGNVAELQGIANFTAQNAKDWEEVLARHLPRLGGVQVGSGGERTVILESVRAPKAPSDSGTLVSSDAGGSVLGLKQLLEAIDLTTISGRNQLEGALARLADAYGRLITRLLEQALCETRNVSGEIKPTTAIKLLLGNTDLSAIQAADTILRLARFFPKPDPNTYLSRAVSWAESLRRSRSPGASKSQRK